MVINVDDLKQMNKRGIYSITNVKNGKKYIGSTQSSFKTRVIQHLSKLNTGKHHCPHLQAAWGLYGSYSFVFSIEEVLDDMSQLLNREKFYLEKYDCCNSGYNANPNPNLSPMFNQNSREKSSKTHTEGWAKLRSSMSEEEYQTFIRDRYKHRYGVPPANKGKAMSEEAKAKMRKPKINGVTAAMKAVHQKNGELAREKADYILVYDINHNWVNTFRCVADLVEYSNSEFNTLPIVSAKGKERFGKSLDPYRLVRHLTAGTCYKGLYFERAPKSRKLSYANGVNSWKAERPIMSQAEGTSSEGAETTGEVKSS